MPLRPYLIISGDFVSTGGMDVANLALATHLARSGREVHLVGYRAAQELTSKRNVIFHRVPKPLNAYTLGAPILGATGLLRAAALSRAHGVTVANGGNCPIQGVNWVHYVHAAFRPVVALRGWRAAKLQAMHPLNVLTERIALRAARLVVTNSERTRRDVIQLVGVPEARVRTVYLGIDRDRFRPPSAEERLVARHAIGGRADRPRVAFVGALVDRRKGFDVLYAAWKALCSSASWDADLVVTGAGAELDTWRARAESDKLADRIRFLGFRRDMPLVLGACDALVAPTRYEAYGMGVHEALCCGLPALVTSSAGIAERYPESLRGLLIDDPESSEALAASLRRWRDHAGALRVETLGFSDRLRARSWDDMARDIVALGDALD
jgi:glycosyltransferase involved in cell wall biosynthesis